MKESPQERRGSKVCNNIHSSQNATYAYSRGAAWEHAGMIAHTQDDASYHVTNTQTQQTRCFLKSEGQADQALFEKRAVTIHYLFNIFIVDLSQRKGNY